MDAKVAYLRYRIYAVRYGLENEFVPLDKFAEFWDTLEDENRHWWFDNFDDPKVIATFQDAFQPNCWEINEGELVQFAERHPEIMVAMQEAVRRERPGLLTLHASLIIRLDFSEPPEDVEKEKQKVIALLNKAFPHSPVNVRTMDEMFGPIGAEACQQPPLDGPLDCPGFDDND